LNRFAESPQADRNNIQPRLGAVYDLRGNGKDVVRGGWGIYTDFGYVNSNVLASAFDAGLSTYGAVFSATLPGGRYDSDGNGVVNAADNFFQVGQPLTLLT